MCILHYSLLVLQLATQAVASSCKRLLLADLGRTVSGSFQPEAMGCTPRSLKGILVPDWTFRKTGWKDEVRHESIRVEPCSTRS